MLNDDSKKIKELGDASLINLIDHQIINTIIQNEQQKLNSNFIKDFEQYVNVEIKRKEINSSDSSNFRIFILDISSTLAHKDLKEMNTIAELNKCLAFLMKECELNNKPKITIEELEEEFKKTNQINSDNLPETQQKELNIFKEKIMLFSKEKKIINDSFIIVSEVKIQTLLKSLFTKSKIVNEVLFSSNFYMTPSMLVDEFNLLLNQY